MDYEFTYDYLGKPVARVSMGHEALGLWLSAEVGVDGDKIRQVLTWLEQLEQGQIKQQQLTGAEYQLCLSEDEVEVISHASRLDAGELPEEVDLDQTDAYAACGLEDFGQLLRSWQAFLHLN